MVRFHWHVEDGYGAFIPPCSMVPHKDTKVQTAVVEIELAGQQLNVEALLTVPPGYLHDAECKDVGIILAHGNDAEEWRGKLLSELALELGKAGHVVMRYHCAQKEQRRQRLFEKALDACATSPFARMCSRWVLAGVGSGARVAAAVGTRCRGNLAGFVFLAYPLMEPMPTSKGASLETSLLPLTRLQAPLLFVQPGQDALCNSAMIRDNLDRMPAHDIRMLELSNADGELKSVQPDGSAKGPLPHTIKRVAAAVLDFVAAVNNNRLDLCKVQQLKGEPLASPDTFGGAAEEDRLEEVANREAAAAAAPAFAALAPAQRSAQQQQQHQQQQQQQQAAQSTAVAHQRLLQAMERQASMGGGNAGLGAAASAAAATQQLQQQLLSGRNAALGGLGALGSALRPGGLPAGNAGLLPALLGLLQGSAGAAGLAAALGLPGAAGAAAAPPQNIAALGLAAQQQIVAAALMSAAAGKRPAEATDGGGEERLTKRPSTGAHVLQLGGPPPGQSVGGQFPGHPPEQ